MTGKEYSDLEATLGLIVDDYPNKIALLNEL